MVSRRDLRRELRRRLQTVAEDPELEADLILTRALAISRAELLADPGEPVDPERVRQIREAVPEGAWFEVSGCGRYDFSSALWMGRTFEEEFGIDGFLDPLRPDDLAGLGRLAGRLDVPLAVGSLYDRPDDFARLMDLGGIDAVRIDPVRLGGLTPARKVAAAGELWHVAVTPVRLPEVGVHLACGVVWGRVGEYVDWFAELFAGGPRFENGQLVAPDDPGLGLTLREDVASRHRV